jgi:hypothetical protein
VKLTKRVKGKGKAAEGGREVRAVPASLRDGRAYGIEIDGVVSPLGGQPPVATTKGWGDLSWLYRPRG